MKTSWKDLSKIELKKIAVAREQLHQAVQLPAITGRCLNPQSPGDTYAALFCDKEQEALLSQCWEGSKLHTALRISDFELVIFDENNKPINSFKLNGKTYDEAFKWLSERINNLGFDSNKLNKKLPYLMPEYPTAKGESFNLKDYSAFTEMQKYYSNADSILKEIREVNPGSSEIRCWPHHFDIAILINIDKNNDPEKTIGVGLSPGDDSYNEPYFYVSPWPYPEKPDKLPDLMGDAVWHTNNWVGAVLTSTAIVNFKTEQEKTTLDVIGNAISLCKNLLLK